MLAQSGVADEDTLYILARLMGGAKKRKKKTYTKPKKQKHKHKKIKLRVLKFFKVGASPGICHLKAAVFSESHITYHVRLVLMARSMQHEGAAALITMPS